MDQQNFPKAKVRLLAFSVSIIILIRFASMNHAWVEEYYSSFFYRHFSSAQRWFLGWLPFSFGDIIYLVLILWIIYSVILFISRVLMKKISRSGIWKGLFNTVFLFVLLYIIFNIFWGLNYNRNSIAEQLHLTELKIDTADLKQMQLLLLKRVNDNKQVLLDSKASPLSRDSMLSIAVSSYTKLQMKYPFIQYANRSVKPSLFGWWGNYLGFTGYYDPFTGEAQVNTTVPKFMQPYTACHEIAHQIGYAKEEEANFVGYLAAVASESTQFHYSTYLDLFVYTNRELYYTDSAAAKQAVHDLLPAVKADLKEWRDFAIKHKNPFEPVIRWIYGNYLKANQQPKGVNSYDEVIVDLIAYYKKYGVI